MDILVAVLGLIFLAPIFGLIAILIRRDTPGPVFYRGPRIGRHGRQFGILKFRTMYEQPASHAGPRVTAQGDRRITPFGQYLRDTKINELPQLWNVLCGEMSLVGPRPEDPTLVNSWPEDLRKEILAVRPGVTSPASILYRDEEKMLSGKTLMEDYLQTILPSKLRLDVVYIRNRTVLTDLDVMMWTAIVLLPQLRDRSIPRHLLYFGPISQLFSRFINWFFVDFLMTLFSFAITGVLWRMAGPLDIGWLPALGMALSVSVLFSLINFVLGLNRVSWTKAQAAQAVELILSAGMATAILVVWDRVVFPPEQIPFSMALTGGGLACFFFIAVRYRERLITGLASRVMREQTMGRTIGERVMIIGAGEMGELASWLFKRGEFARLFAVTGMVDDDPRKVGMVVAGCPVLGTSDQLADLIARYDVGILVFAITQIQVGARERILSACRKTPARLVMFPDLISSVKTSLMVDGMGRTEVPDVDTLPSMPDCGCPEPAAGGVDADELGAWLGGLDELLEDGNVAAARGYVARMRQKFTERS